MASFFTNAFNSAINGIGSGINYVDNTGIGHFFTNTLNSTSNLLSGLSSIPASLTGLVNGIASNSSLFLYAVIGIGLVILVNDFKGSSSSYSSRYS